MNYCTRSRQFSSNSLMLVIYPHIATLVIILFLLSLSPLQGVIECPSPDKDIRRFDGNLRLFPPFLDNDVCPLTIKNTILQSCYLRNTEWACGVAVYTGKFLRIRNFKVIANRILVCFLCVPLIFYAFLKI